MVTDADSFSKINIRWNFYSTMAKYSLVIISIEVWESWICLINLKEYLYREITKQFFIHTCLTSWSSYLIKASLLLWRTALSNIRFLFVCRFFYFALILRLIVRYLETIIIFIFILYCEIFRIVSSYQLHTFNICIIHTTNL